MNVNGQNSFRTEESTVTQNAGAADGNGTALSLNVNDTELAIRILGADTPLLDVILEVSFDNGSTYVNAFAEDLLAAAGIATLVNVIAATTSTKRYRYRVPPGASNFRTRIANRATGNATVTVVKRVF